jgi:hypothetical protein
MNWFGSNEIARLQRIEAAEAESSCKFVEEFHVRPGITKGHQYPIDRKEPVWRRCR